MRTDKVLLSIIIPVYNVENYLTFCVDSVFKQGLHTSQFEVLLIDDGSKDNSYQVCLDLQKKYPNIRLFKQENSGQSVARNRGIEEAKGVYIYFVDSDDYLLLGGIGKILKLAVETECDFVGFGSKSVRNRQEQRCDENLNVILKGNGIYLLAHHNYNNGPWWYIFKKEKFPNFYFIPNRLCEDGLFTSQLISSVKNGIIVENVIYQYVDTPNSTLNTNNTQQLSKIRDDMYFIANSFNEILSKLDNNDKNYVEAFRRLKARQESYLFFALVRSIKTNEKAKNVIEKINSCGNEYPINTFDGYQSNLNKLLIKMFNNRWLLSLILNTNNILNIFKK